jgi:hypothetical protein
MSDDIVEVATSYVDVAELGQGYVDRADGERMLLPLPRAVAEGEGVRFIVHLADGTPAFAGAGRCVQVDDRGSSMPADQRYETLLDSLAFDERSQPVYDYIVAVRQMAYADAAPEDPSDEAVYESEEVTVSSEGTQVTLSSDHPTAEIATIDAASQPPESLAPVAAVEALPRDPEPVDDEASFAEVSTSDPPREPVREPARAVEPDYSHAVLASVLPEPLPTGMLTRPALAAHWAPAAPRPPRPSTRPSRFRYTGGALPVPGEPPRPVLDRSAWVEPAAAPRA